METVQDSWFQDGMSATDGYVNNRADSRGRESNVTDDTKLTDVEK